LQKDRSAKSESGKFQGVSLCIKSATPNHSGSVRKKAKPEVIIVSQEIKTAASSGKTQINRRDFLKFCGLMAVALALPKSYAQTIAQALAATKRLPIIWLEFQDCTGDSESFIRASQCLDPVQTGVTDPGVVDLILSYLSVDYHETLMAPTGAQTELSLNDTLNNYPGQYVAIVEGSIPTAQNGVYCTIRGRTALSIAQQVLPNAKAVIALGSCAADGGLAAAAPNPTGAVGVAQAVPGLQKFIALPGCPANVTNLVATIVHLLTFNDLPPRDASGRPYFAYGAEIHDHCERRPFYDNGQFVLAWGDAGHRQGWCLSKMGCKGPVTEHNCPLVKWNGATSRCVASGHGCIGCASPHFWDTQSPFYKAL
jgi:hydrogenase small subunit